MAAILKAILAAIGRFFGSIFSAEVNVEENVRRIVANFDKGRDEIKSGIARVKAFKFDPKWKSRVINAPDAIDHLRDLYDSAFGDFQTRLDKLRKPLHEFVILFKAEREPDPLGNNPSGLAKAAVKIDELATLIKQLADASDTALEFIEAFDEIILNLQSLDAIF